MILLLKKHATLHSWLHPRHPLGRYDPVSAVRQATPVLGKAIVMESAHSPPSWRSRIALEVGIPIRRAIGPVAIATRHKPCCLVIPSSDP